MYIFQKVLDGKDIQNFFCIVEFSRRCHSWPGWIVIDLLSLISVVGSCGVFVKILRYSFGRGLKIFLASGESHCVVFGCWMSLLLLRVVDDRRGNNDSNHESSSWMSFLSNWDSEAVAS